jgi:hypothetical protein
MVGRREQPSGCSRVLHSSVSLACLIVSGNESDFCLLIVPLFLSSCVIAVVTLVPFYFSQRVRDGFVYDAPAPKH